MAATTKVKPRTVHFWLSPNIKQDFLTTSVNSATTTTTTTETETETATIGRQRVAGSAGSTTIYGP